MDIVDLSASCKNYEQRKNKQGKVVENPSSLNKIIIHTSGTKESSDPASRFLYNAINGKISSHYAIGRNNVIFQLVKDKYKAFHAGFSYWNDKEGADFDINSSSIGIELIASTDNVDGMYTERQIESLIELINYLKKEYNIKKQNILGHSDIAPGRKKDPTKFFPWERLSKKGLVFSVNPDIPFLGWVNSYNACCILNKIGYLTSAEKLNSEKAKDAFKNFVLSSAAVRAFQSRYTPINVTGNLDGDTLKAIENIYIQTELERQKEKNSLSSNKSLAAEQIKDMFYNRFI